MATQTVGAIALRPIRNRQGGYYFMSLLSGRIRNRSHATPLPMPAKVITQVHDLAEAQEIEPDLAFGNQDNILVAQGFPEDDEHDSTYVGNAKLSDDESLYYDEADDEVDRAETNNDATEAGPLDLQDPDEEQIQDPGLLDEINDFLLQDDNEPEGENIGMEEIQGVRNGGVENEGVGDDGLEDHGENPAMDNQLEEEPTDENNDIASAMDAAYGTRNSSYNLRRQQRPKYSHFGDVYVG